MKTIIRKSLMSGISVIFLAGAASAAEEAKYDVVKKYGGFELRRYDPYLVAECEVKGGFEGAAYQAFSLLAGYIGGNNVKQEEIAMTSPVSQRPAKGEKIAMTSPVIQESGPESEEGETYLLSFVMPAGYTMENIPRPADPRVKIRKAPARLIAARTYSGTWSEKNYRENEKALLDALRKSGLETVGDPIYARYDPPWTLWFNRRNEVLIEVTEKSAGIKSGKATK